MELTVNLPNEEMRRIYYKILWKLSEDRIDDLLHKSNYLKDKGIDDLSKTELFGAIATLHETMVRAIDEVIEQSGIAERAVDDVISRRPPKNDLLNEVLKMIGLETMQCFRIDDVEFKDQTLRIDSFGDVYVVVTEATDDFYEEGDEVEHDYLTLGRILTQYYDKIVPWDIKETGYA